jgi:hypothetical protein
MAGMKLIHLLRWLSRLDETKSPSYVLCDLNQMQVYFVEQPPMPILQSQARSLHTPPFWNFLQTGSGATARFPAMN